MHYSSFAPTDIFLCWTREPRELESPVLHKYLGGREKANDTQENKNQDSLSKRFFFVTGFNVCNNCCKCNSNVTHRKSCHELPPCGTATMEYTINEQNREGCKSTPSYFTLMLDFPY